MNNSCPLESAGKESTRYGSGNRFGAGMVAEAEEEVVVEALGLAFLVSGVRPLAGEGPGAGADLVPGEAHAAAVLFQGVPAGFVFAAALPPSSPEVNPSGSHGV